MSTHSSTKANYWDEWKAEIKSKMQDFRSLSILTRFHIWMTQEPSQRIDARETEVMRATQSYRTYLFNGQEYFYKWGWK